jgi:hypothetical protein
VKFQHLMYGLDAVLWHLIDEVLKLVASRHHAGIISKVYAILNRLKPTRGLAITGGSARPFVHPNAPGYLLTIQ